MQLFSSLFHVTHAVLSATCTVNVSTASTQLPVTVVNGKTSTSLCDYNCHSSVLNNDILGFWYVALNFTSVYLLSKHKSLFTNIVHMERAD